MRTTLPLLLTIGIAAAAFSNNPPVPGNKPEYTIGNGTTGIELEIVYDLMCSDSAARDPAFQDFLNMTFLDSTVREHIKVSYTFLPLPYHHGVWIPHKIVPYILDECKANKDKCIFEQYMQYCWAHQADVLDAKNTSQDDLINQWTKQISENFNLPVQDLKDLFDPNTDKHDSEMRTRELYKYNTHHGVSGTPFAFVNGILLESFPNTAQDWMDMLNFVYAEISKGNAY